MKPSEKNQNIELKVQASISILSHLGLPPKQQNERSGRTLLALLDLKPAEKWESAKKPLIGIHDIIEFVAQYYNFKYAENSRESIRRQTIHQFEQAGLIERNPDDPSRPTNSGNTVYSITDIALDTIKHFSHPLWSHKVKDFKARNGSLIEKYSSIRKRDMVPLKVDGVQFYLSSGKHNNLQKEIINSFGPKFAAGADILYLGDTAKKTVIFKDSELRLLGITVTNHDKLPDIVLCDHKKKWIYLIEAVTSHGPVSPKRHAELEKILAKCKYGRVYVSAFMDLKTFSRYTTEIAWETEVWIAESPDHLVHFNGDRFFGPHKT